MTTEGQRFPETARPDEKTVQKVAAGAARESPPRRRRQKRQSKAPELTSTRVDPRVWRTALGLAAHPRNIQIVSETEVIVWNHEAPWPTGT